VKTTWCPFEESWETSMISSIPLPDSNFENADGNETLKPLQ